MQEHQNTVTAALMEQLIKEGPEGLGQVFTALFELAMRLERERYLDAAVARQPSCPGPTTKMAGAGRCGWWFRFWCSPCCR